MSKKDSQPPATSRDGTTRYGLFQMHRAAAAIIENIGVCFYGYCVYSVIINHNCHCVSAYSIVYFVLCHRAMLTFLTNI